MHNPDLLQVSASDSHSMGQFNMARPQNLWGIDIRLAHFRPINKAFMGLFYRNLFRTTYSRRFLDKNYHHGDTEEI